jgi:maltose alpha-D-glucosyltransferase/alpha-amylase
LPEAVAELARALLARRDALLARLRAHGEDAPAGAKTRLHGDFHLGQVLRVENDFVITDFEGEPARDLDERRRKASPLKDVAGMLRSYDYAMHAALARFVAERPQLRATLEPLAAQWRELARAAFRAGYDEVAAAAGLPTAAQQETKLLELFTLEKALYELAYELDNRPDWVGIPLAGLAAILDRLPTGEEASR